MLCVFLDFSEIVMKLSFLSRSYYCLVLAVLVYNEYVLNHIVDSCSILNKLTPEKFDILKGQLIDSGITSADILKVFYMIS